MKDFIMCDCCMYLNTCKSNLKGKDKDCSSYELILDEDITLKEHYFNSQENKKIYMIALCDQFRHLICSPYSIDNLHEMAKILDIKKCWFHKTHYDIPKRRIAEIQSRCQVVSQKELLSIIKAKL